MRFNSTVIAPYVWNKSTGDFVTYDDPVSISYKREYAASQGMQGMMMWELANDHNGELLSYMN